MAELFNNKINELVSSWSSYDMSDVSMGQVFLIWIMTLYWLEFSKNKFYALIKIVLFVFMNYYIEKYLNGLQARKVEYLGDVMRHKWAYVSCHEKLIKSGAQYSNITLQHLHNSCQNHLSVLDSEPVGVCFSSLKDFILTQLG